MWGRGDEIVVRYLRDGRVAWVLPVTVVEDGDDLSVLFMRAGTPTKQVEAADGSPIDPSLPYEKRCRIDWRLGDGRWGPHQTLLVTPTRAAHSIRLIWTETWDFLGWYVNLQVPQVRTELGFDTSDQVLDIWVEPDQSWRWGTSSKQHCAWDTSRRTMQPRSALRASA